MSAPLAVNTKDGVCWTRRTVTSSGIALYAPEGVCRCPEFVMATLAELAEHGITGQADVLPMPVGPVPRSELDQARDDVMGACLARWEEERDNARLRLALASAQRGRRELRDAESFAEGSRQRWRTATIEAEQERDTLRARVAELEAQRQADHETWQHDLRTARSEREASAARIAELEAERHSTNEALDDAVQELRARQVPNVDRSADRLTRLLAPTQALREDAAAEAGGAR